MENELKLRDKMISKLVEQIAHMTVYNTELSVRLEQSVATAEALHLKNEELEEALTDMKAFMDAQNIVLGDYSYSGGGSDGNTNE